MQELMQILRFIAKHPLAKRNKAKAFRRLISWQVRQLVAPKAIVYTLLEKSKLVVSKGMAGATGNIYTGLHEFEDMFFLLHYLKKGDLFADVGANVGVYSILASVNAGAYTVALEPIPKTFENLKSNIAINDAWDCITPLQVGAGCKNELLHFSNDVSDTINHVVTDAKIQNNDSSIVEVPVKTLNEIFCNKDVPALIKIDVEGFELSVLEGASDLLENKKLNAIIIEINGCGERYGVSDNQIHAFLIEKGFAPYQYKPFARKLIPLSSFGPLNTIYIRDVEAARKRIVASRKYQIFGENI